MQMQEGAFYPMAMDGLKTATPGIQRLADVVRRLQKVELLLHSKNAQRPTVAEYRLYGQIIRHVRLYILLFFVEKGLSVPKWLSREKLPEVKENDEYELLWQLLPICSGKNSFNDISWPSGKAVSEELSVSFRQGGGLLYLLRETRKHASEMSKDNKMSFERKKDNYMTRHKHDAVTVPAIADSSGKAVAGSFQEIQPTIREHNLFSILNTLEDMGSLRSYSPPNEQEISYYQEIRMRLISCLEYIEVKPAWFYYIRKWNLVTKEDKCEDDWHRFYRDNSSYCTSYAPTGYVLSSALDELPDLLLLAKECSSQFSNICSSLYESKGVEAVSDDCDILMLGDNSNSNVRYDEVEHMSQSKHGLPCYLCCQVHMFGHPTVVTRTREQYLQGILRVFKKMGPLSLDTQLDVVEGRFYAQILEHVISSIWMFGERPWNLRGGSAGSEETQNLVDSGSSASGYSASDDESSRKEYLHEILLSVEAIKSSFLDTPPSTSEVVLYKEIFKHMSQELLNSKACGLEQGEAEYTGMDGFAPATAMSKRLLGVAYDWELGFCKEVNKEYGEMVRSLFPDIIDADEFVDPLEWAGKCSKDHRLSDLARRFSELPNGVLLLDQLLLMFTKVDQLFDDSLVHLNDANEYMDTLLSRKMGLKAAHEVSGALEILKFRLSSPPLLKALGLPW